MARWLRLGLGIALALAGAGCVIDAPESAVSRFEVAWEFADGLDCEQHGAQRVRLQSTLHADETPRPFIDDLPCEDEIGRTRPLEPGPYDVQLVALSPEGDAVGQSELRTDVQLGPEESLELVPFEIQPAP